MQVDTPLDAAILRSVEMPHKTACDSMNSRRRPQIERDVRIQLRFIRPKEFAVDNVNCVSSR